MPDTPQRIATDTSQKLAIRFGETIKAYAADEGRDVGDLKLIPLVLAGWLRYLMGIDDKGEKFTLSLIRFLKNYVRMLQKSDWEIQKLKKKSDQFWKVRKFLA